MTFLGHPTVEGEIGRVQRKLEEYGEVRGLVDGWGRGWMEDLLSLQLELGRAAQVEGQGR